MSMAALRWARSIRGITGTQKLVLTMLADSANDYAEAWPSAVAIAEDACITERTARDALDALEEAGLISGRRAHGHAARWTLNLVQARAAAKPEAHSAGPEAPSAPPEPASGVKPESQAKRHPGRSFRTTPEAASCPPRKEVPGTPEAASDRTLRTPIEPSIEPPGGRTAPRPPTIILPPWLPTDAWADWCTHRRGKSWTQRSAELTLKQLSDLRDAGDDPRQVIEQSIAAGWRGLFPLKSGRSLAAKPFLTDFQRECLGVPPAGDEKPVRFDFDATAEPGP